MAKLVYITNMSLDGYVEDRHGGIDWGEPDEEYFGLINDLVHPVGTYLYGRRMYESMVYWESAPVADQASWIVDFTSIWRAADKVVFSRSLTAAPSDRTTLEPTFDVEAIRRMKEIAARDLTIGGSGLAAQAFGAGLVDECHLIVWPVVLGGGKVALPQRERIEFELLDEGCLSSGIVRLHYRVAQ